MTETWRQSDEVIRNIIAREIWRYQECEEAYGDFDKVSADTSAENQSSSFSTI